MRALLASAAMSSTGLCASFVVAVAVCTNDAPMSVAMRR
jgi:hypothetical protein